MKTLIALAVLVAPLLVGSSFVAAKDPPGEPGEIAVLQDFIWVPVMVRRAPTSVECKFEVVTGRPTVHAELVSDRDFARFKRGRPYDILVQTGTASIGQFSEIIRTPGSYHLLVRNNPGAPPVAVKLVVHTELDPGSAFIGASPRRIFGVVAMSLGVFLGTVLWSGRRLWLAWERRQMAPPQ